MKRVIIFFQKLIETRKQKTNVKILIKKISSPKVQALKWLEVMRNPYVSYNYWPHLKKILRENNLKVEDIATTECELVSLIKSANSRYAELRKVWQSLELKPKAIKSQFEGIY